jgi:hypothetical protein
MGNRRSASYPRIRRGRDLPRERARYLTESRYWTTREASCRVALGSHPPRTLSRSGEGDLYHQASPRMRPVGYEPQIWAVIRGIGRGKSRSKPTKLTRVRRLRWLRPQSHSYDTWISGIRSGQASPSGVQLEDLAVLTLDRVLQNLLDLRPQVLPTRLLLFSPSNTPRRNLLWAVKHFPARNLVPPKSG